MQERSDGGEEKCAGLRDGRSIIKGHGCLTICWQGGLVLLLYEDREVLGLEIRLVIRSLAVVAPDGDRRAQ